VVTEGRSSSVQKLVHRDNILGQVSSLGYMQHGVTWHLSLPPPKPDITIIMVRHKICGLPKSSGMETNSNISRTVVKKRIVIN